VAALLRAEVARLRASADALEACAVALERRTRPAPPAATCLD
jgi:hypothetical protein